MEMIEAYLEHLREAGSPKATTSGRRRILYKLNRDLEYGVGEVSTDELKAWLHRDGLSLNSKGTYYRCLNSFYLWASDPEDPWLTDNPMYRVPAIATPKGYARACTDEQAEVILTRSADPYRLCANLAAYQGLRCIEISGLDREHITAQQLIVIRGKGGDPRVHDTDPGIWEMVKDLPPGPVARLRTTGERMPENIVSQYCNVHFRKNLGVRVTMHQLRHWLGVNVQRRYKNARVTQRMLGHKTLQSTQIYTDATDEEQAAARATLPRFSA